MNNSHILGANQKQEMLYDVEQLAKKEAKSNNNIPSDRLRKVIKQHERFGFKHLIAYALSIIETRSDLKPNHYNEAMKKHRSIFLEISNDKRNVVPR